MTQITRASTQPQPVPWLTLVRVGMAVGSTILVVMTLLQMDRFPKVSRKQLRAPVLLSPGTVLQEQQQQQQKQDRTALQRNHDSSSEETQKEVSEANQGPDAIGSEETDELKGKQFVMELANLKPDSSDTESITTGRIRFETKPAWAPIGVQHFHQLVEAGFYNQCRFFRVVPNFVVQFGIAADPNVQDQWRRDVLQDDPVATTNARGTLTYATSGKNTRTTQLFINSKNNAFLDEQGFAPFAVVLDDGMSIVDRINDEYREQPQQGRIQKKGNEYLESAFPNLSYIVTLREATPDDIPD